MCTYFRADAADYFIGRILSEKQIWGYGQELKAALHAELNKIGEAATSSYSATGEFLQYIYVY